MVLIAWLLTALAQEPAVAEWKVLETEHYRVHYPEPAEAWTKLQVQRMEAIRARVAEEVGWEPDFKVQVLVQDPYSEANGAVLPLGRSPRMMLWTTPPGADSVIGNYRDWGELLFTHEDAHVVHLLRPARGLSGQLMFWLFRLSPVTIKSPRWVLEGYATVVEGRLTGSGRPHGALRGTLLRRLAQQGALPSYGELSGSSRWQGFGYAYLVGSAYLEWLEAREGEGALRDLWARMTARKVRNFDQAFEGVFGDKPWVLYKRFTAEVTRDAMAADGADWDRSTLWMDTSWSTGIPALSPSGERLAVTVDSADDPAVLKVWKTEVNDKAVEKRAERIAEILERDPEDVAAKDPRHAPHETVASLMHRTHPARNPRWLDEDTLLYDSGDFDGLRQYRRDLFTWNVETGAVRRVTRHADVRDADPHPDGDKAVVVHGSWGRTALATVDLETGSLTPLTELSAEVIVDQPRYSPDGTKLLYLKHTGASFFPVVRDLDAGTDTPLGLPDGAAVIHAAWDGDEVIASLGIAGRLDLWRLSDDAEPVRLTDSGAALAPEPAEEGVYFLQMQADGFEVHYRPDGPEFPPPTNDIGWVGTAPPVDAEQPESVVLEGRALGIGRLEPRFLAGGMVGQGASNFELGVRLGDIVGRNDFVAMGALGDTGGTSGGSLWWANRTLPGDLEIRLWGVQDGITPPWWLGTSLAIEVEGGTANRWSVARLGGWVEAGTDGTERGEAFLSVSGSVVESRTRLLRLWGDVRLSAGQHDGFTATLAEGRTGFVLGRTWTLSSDYTLGIAGGEPFRLGGVTSGLRADEAQWRTLRNGWLAPDTANGTVHDRMEWALGSGGIDLYLERRRIWTGLGRLPYTLSGLRIVQSVDHQSLVKVPGVDIEIGIGCAFERGAIVDRPCLKLEDYRTWSGLVWRP